MTWDAIQWTWTNGQVAQRVLRLAVDNHEDDAPFPEPRGGFGTTFNSMFTVLFRGKLRGLQRGPNLKDDRCSPSSRTGWYGPSRAVRGQAVTAVRPGVVETASAEEKE